MCDTTKPEQDPNAVSAANAASAEPEELRAPGGMTFAGSQVPKKQVSTKFGTFLKYAIPALQGAAYGAGSAEPTRALGGSSFGASLASAMGRVGAHNQQTKMLQHQMALEALDRQMRLATLQNTMRHQGVLEGQGAERVDQGSDRIDAMNRRLEDYEKKLAMPRTGDEPLDAPSQGGIAPVSSGGAGGGSFPALPSMDETPRNIFSGNPVKTQGSVPTGILGGMPTDALMPSLTKTVTDKSVMPSTPAQATKPGAALPPATSGSRVSQLNQGLSARYKILNPGKELPSEFTLPPTATQKDFDRIDKLMEATEKAQGTKAQQETVNEMRRQTQELAKTKQDQSEQALDVAAKSIAGGDLTSLRDITSMRGDQRLLLYAKIKKLNPQFDTSKVQRQIEMMDNFTNKKQGDQLQSFGTFLEHAGALKDVMDGLKNTKSKILNTPLNNLRQQIGDSPEIQRVVAALDPVQKEFESYLLNNRALYTEDRATVDKIISGDLPPDKFMAALQQMGHTVQARYNEADNRFRNTMNGKSLEEFFPLTDEAKDGARKIGVTLGKTARTSSGGNIHPAAQAYLSKFGKPNAGTATTGANP